MPQQQSVVTPYPISDFMVWADGTQLEITPKFQRRDVWVEDAKSYLIDTIVRGLPVPPIFLRLTLDIANRKAVREVVDGQQRLRAILGYIRGEFPISPIHSSDYGGLTFSQLPTAVQEDILTYKLDVHVLEGVSDADVLSLFARLNTYTLSLNPQELRNASFFGHFKQLVYELSLEHYAFWTNNRIFNDRRIARMAEAELVSELLLTMLEGIRSTRGTDLHEAYRKYDKQFAKRSIMHRQFNETFDVIGAIFDGNVGRTRFRTRPLFYSMYVLICDALFGVPNSEHERTHLDSASITQVQQRLTDLERKLKEPEVGSEHERFIYVARAATADVSSRRFRHDFLWHELLQG